MKKRNWWGLIFMVMVISFLSGCSSLVTKEYEKVSLDYSSAEGNGYVILFSPIQSSVTLRFEIEYKGDVSDEKQYEIATQGTHDGITRISMTRTFKIKAGEVKILHVSDLNETLFSAENARILSVELVRQEVFDLSVTIFLILLILFLVCIWTAFIFGWR